ncbi:uncharacterized protein LOC125663333 [Ostrea edulis]|uniref:uncharacterized protein LOC125663333 n=1 Tax=Ostrea edulis TaxID=37623 RepID=UPI0024AEBBF3|nr:uncharacterized protein LOC125663333 [Ostrea edulis]
MPEADVYIDLTEDVTVEVTSYCDSQTQTDDNAMVTSVDTKEIEVQTKICLDNLCEFTTEDFQKHTNITRKLFMKSVLKDDESCKFYTGLTIAMLIYVFTWLQKKAEKLNYWRGQDTTESKTNIKVGPKRKLTTKEEFIITLVRLRRGFDVEVISDLFGVHPSQISRIFTTWINFLYAELKFLISWPSREQIASNIPKAFKHFPTTRSIIDCTEFFVQKPSLPSSQRVTWSQYKHHNTFKALISISPTGTFTFISKLFTGSISDRRIVEESGFLEKIEHGDDIMADRGFLIRDMLARRSATLNIPPFSMGKQLSSRAVTKTRRIASARIHVERAIGRSKTFKILQGVMPLKLHVLFDQIVGVCGVLCNLDTQLVK